MSDPTTDEFGLPLAAIVCLAVGGYVILVIIIIVIRNCLVSRGLCTCGSPCQCGKEEEGSHCCSCVKFAEICTCASPNVTSCVNVICPKKKNLGCMDMILCHCCGDGEAVPNACGCLHMDCDFNFTYINCCCFTVHLAKNEPWPFPSEPWASPTLMYTSERHVLTDFSKNAMARNISAEPCSFEGAASSQTQVPSTILSNKSPYQKNHPTADSNTATCLTLQEIPSHTSVASKKSHLVEGGEDEAKAHRSVDKTELDLNHKNSKREQSTHIPVRTKSANITNPYSPRSKSSTHQYSSRSKSSTITNPYSARSAISSNSSHSGTTRISRSASPQPMSRSLPTKPSSKK